MEVKHCRFLKVHSIPSFSSCVVESHVFAVNSSRVGRKQESEVLSGAKLRQSQYEKQWSSDREACGLPRYG